MLRAMKSFARLLCAITVLFCRADAPAAPPPGFVSEIVVVGLDQPTSLEFLPDGRMLVGELQNYIFVVQPNAGVPNATPFLQLSGSGLSGGQGLMSIKLDPDFDVNGYFYVFYCRGSLSRNRVSRFTANGNTASAASEVVLWQDIQNATDEHQGGGLDFGPDGKLYITVGEAFVPDDAQRLTSYRGKILRINRDGTVPTDNPFHDGAGSNLDAIWAYGLRNPFRASFDSVTGRLFISEVGGNDPEVAVEEINLGLRGANYGWPLCEGACPTPGFTSPLHGYPHAGRDASVIGGVVYRGNSFPNAYYGAYFFGDYAQNWIRYLTFNTNGTVASVGNFEPADGSMDGDFGDPTCVKVGPDGAIYYTDFSHDLQNFWAMVRRIRYAGANLPPVVSARASVTAGVPPLTVNFSSTGSFDPEGRPLSYLWTFGNGQSSTNANPTHIYTQSGQFLARLAVSDGTNTTLSNPLTIIAGNAPKVIVQSPTNGTRFRALDTIAFQASATDFEDGTLPASALNWNIVFHHDAHIHPVNGPWSNTNRGSLFIADTGHPYGTDTSYELVVIGTDSSGLQASASVTVLPDLVNLAVGTTPAGLSVDLDGIRRVTPFTDATLKGFRHTINAPPQSGGNSNFYFQSWTDGGAQAHEILIPTNHLSLTARYLAGGPGQAHIESMTRLSNGVQLRFTTESGLSYLLQRSPNMLPGTWTNLGTHAGNGSLITIVDPLPLNGTQAFYRIALFTPENLGSPGFAAASEVHAQNTRTFNTALNVTGQNRALLVGICWNDPQGDSVQSITCNGAPIPLLAMTNWFYGTGRLALYGLTAPATGANTISLTMTANARELALAAVLFTNVNQLASFGVPAMQYLPDDANAIAVSVPSTAGDLVTDFFGYYAFEPTPGPGQTERATSINPDHAKLRITTKPSTPPATPMSWSATESAQISLIGVAVKSR